MKPIVSIIIPVYKSEKYLKECLDSCVNQTEKNIEIICVNDCSPDGSEKIIKNYLKKDSRIKLINLDKNSGPGTARNAGVEQATGEYIWFVDSDDYIDLNACKNIYDIASKDDLEIIRFNALIFENIDDGKKIIKSHYLSTWPINKIFTNDEIKLLPVDNQVVPWMFWTKTEVLKKFKFRENVYYEDTDFTPILFSYSKKLMVTIYTAYYQRKTSGSIMQSKVSEKHIRDRMLFIESFNKYIIENNIKKNTFLYNEYLSLTSYFWREINKNYSLVENSSELKDKYDSIKLIQKKIKYDLKLYKFKNKIRRFILKKL